MRTPKPPTLNESKLNLKCQPWASRHSLFVQSCLVGSSISCVAFAMSNSKHCGSTAVGIRQTVDPAISVGDIVIAIERATTPPFLLRRIWEEYQYESLYRILLTKHLYCWEIGLFCCGGFGSFELSSSEVARHNQGSFKRWISCEGWLYDVW